jgi:ribosomal subunit interface protein
MKHDHEDFERTTMPEQLPRDVKRTAGRTPTGMTPVTVRGHHVQIDAHHRAYVRERLGRRLAKFAPAIERIHVRIEDLNGPKGGLDHSCRIVVTLSGLGQVVVEERHEEAIPAFDMAADRTEIALQHRLGKVREGTSNRRRAEEQRRDAITAPGEGGR